MACSPIKRKEIPFRKDSEMASGHFSHVTKKCKVEYFTNGEPVHEEVRTKLKGHHPLL